MKLYPIAFEVAGETGMFAEPVTGSESTSYPVPPPTACKGIIESIAWRRGVEVEPVAVACCSRPQFAPSTYNSQTAFRKSSLVSKNDACQMHETMLWQPRFQIIAVLRNYEPRGSGSVAHAMQHTFFERLVRGQCRFSTSLGRKEHLATYMGFPITPVATNVQMVLPSMCLRILDRDSCINRVYGHQLRIRQGVLCFSSEIGAEVENGILTFSDAYLKREIAFLLQKWSRKRHDQSNLAIQR
jgi:CRISPR-associated Cas5-like protein